LLVDPFLLLDHVSARYGTTTVLEDLSLPVEAGELVSLLGASGCGKTTTLRLVAGFLEPAAGRIKIAGRDVTPLPAHKRDIGLVFQNYALFPHLSVADNVAFGLRQRGVDGAERRKQALAMLERVGLAAFADRMPAALSGGQRQRVALARALVIRPTLLMFDEPLSNLDAKLRVEMRVEIRALQRANGTTSVYVTHDQEEAFSISDRVAIMDAGRIVQFDRPEVLYRQPKDAFVARFVGFENLVPMRVVDRFMNRVTVELEGGDRVDLLPEEFGPIPDLFTMAARADGIVALPDSLPGLTARVALRTYLGRSYQYRMDTEAGPVIANVDVDTPLAIGAPARLQFAAQQCCMLPEG
jgi:putative spermidine/putrescine transport system ATP-binding protein